MPEAVVVIKYPPSPPLPGKKQGTIKTTDNQIYGIAPSMLGMVKEGGTYKIFFESREFQGKTYHTIKTVNEVMAPPPKAETPAGGRHDDRGPKSWVCSLLGHAFACGKLDPLSLTDIVEAGRIYRDAERLIFSEESVPEQRANGPAPRNPSQASGQTQAHPQTAADFDDAIPF